MRGGPGFAAGVHLSCPMGCCACDHLGTDMVFEVDEHMKSRRLVPPCLFNTLESPWDVGGARPWQRAVVQPTSTPSLCWEQALALFPPELGSLKLP